MTELTDREQYLVALIMGLMVIKTTNIEKKLVVNIMNEIRTTMYSKITETEMYDMLDGLEKIEQKLSLTMNTIKKSVDNNVTV